MLSQEWIAQKREECLKLVSLKAKEAATSHDWVIDSHSLSSCQLLELLRFAELGFKAWTDGGPKQ